MEAFSKAFIQACVSQVLFYMENPKIFFEKRRKNPEFIDLTKVKF